MNELITTEELRAYLRAHLDTVAPPPADLDAVRRHSRDRRVRRVMRPALLAAAAVSIGALALDQATPPTGGMDDETGVVTGGPVDVSEGLRAFASPDGDLHMAGQKLTGSTEGLDTDAVATPYGIAFYDENGWPWLLEPGGRKVQLDASPSDPADDFSPTVKADAARPYVAYAVMDDGEVTVSVFDLEDRSVVASTDITCPDGCSDLVIDGIDSGVVFIRTEAGTGAWDYEGLESFRFAGPETRVADVRNQVVLYDGVRPTVEMDGWRYVSGAIDAQLSFDGEYVLYWSDELTSTRVGGTDVIKLDLPVPATFFALDTDGSVLAATVNDPSRVFDCVLPSGRCEPIGEMNTTSGDPMFIGTDM